MAGGERMIRNVQGPEETKRRIGARQRREALEARLLDGDGDLAQPMSVGRASVPTEPVFTGVAVVRYLALMVCMAILAAGGAIGLGWGLVPALFFFGCGATLGIILIALIETRQISAVLNSVLDYVLMASNMSNLQDLRYLLLERSLDLEESEQRHRMMIERQGFWMENQERVLRLAVGTDREALTKRAFVASVARPEVLVDSMIEDYLAQSMRSFTVTLLDTDANERKLLVDEADGRVLTRVPWEAGNASMADDEKAMAKGILDAISRSGPPLFTVDSEGDQEKETWFFNLDVYERPIDIIRAFDRVYGAQS